MDLRKYASQTKFRLLIGALLLLFLVGSGLIGIFYGPRAMLFGLLCLAVGLLPVALIVLFFWILERIAKRDR